ncbi:ADP-ribosylation factor-related protein 1-like [Corticium candelabrum]|uniref:ADP-ribosylation factor-related protein 1-like n=1 Tax=Corticium candelabrum TaxID=121492 RepID=UPI002E273430|nr:ADP-ribosylation factor-related protein 1-like [Corticium candelabrum]
MICYCVYLLVGKIDVSSVELVFWDLGGQEDLQCLWNKYYDDCHGVIYIIDSTDRERLEKSRDAFKLMISDASLEKVPLLIICNKQDLPERISKMVSLIFIVHPESTQIESEVVLVFRTSPTMTQFPTNQNHLHPHANIFGAAHWIFTKFKLPVPDFGRVHAELFVYCGQCR